MCTLSDQQKSDIKSALKTFNDMEEGLMLLLKRKDEGEKVLDLDSIFQTILDTHMELRILKNIMVKCCGIEDLDSPRKKYGDEHYPDKMAK